MIFLKGHILAFAQAIELHFPGIKAHTCTTCMGSQDMMPTMLGMLELPIPGTVEGEDCSSIILKGKEQPERMSFLCACPGNADYLRQYQTAGKNPKAHGWRAVHTKRYTYVLDAGYKPEPVFNRFLYDNEKDPFQMHPLDIKKGKAKKFQAIWKKNCVIG